MEDDILYSLREMVVLLSEYNISVIHEEDGSFLLVRFTGEKLYIPLAEKTKSYAEILELMCEVASQVHFTLKEKKDNV